MGGKGFEVCFENEKLIIKNEGKFPKFVNKVNQISFSGGKRPRNRPGLTYITERCVLKLSSEGIVLTEIAPGMDLEKRHSRQDGVQAHHLAGFERNGAKTL